MRTDTELAVDLGQAGLVESGLGVVGPVLGGGPLLLRAALDADGQLGQPADEVAAHHGPRRHLDFDRPGPALDLGGLALGRQDAGQTMLDRIAPGDGLAGIGDRAPAPGAVQPGGDLAGFADGGRGEDFEGLGDGGHWGRLRLGARGRGDASVPNTITIPGVRLAHFFGKNAPNVSGRLARRPSSPAWRGEAGGGPACREDVPGRSQWGPASRRDLDQGPAVRDDRDPRRLRIIATLDRPKRKVECPFFAFHPQGSDERFPSFESLPPFLSFPGAMSVLDSPD